MGFFDDPLGSVSHAVRGTARAVDRAVGGRPTQGDIQAQQANEAAAAQASNYANMTPEERDAEAKRQAMGAGPTYLEKWEQVQPDSYSLGGDPNQANVYAQQALQTGQDAQQYMNQAAQQSQGVGYEFGQQLANSGNAAQQFGQNAGEAAMGFGQQQAYQLGQMGQGYQQQGNAMASRNTGDPNFAAMNQSLNKADPNFASARNALGQSTGYTQDLANIERQEGPSAAQAQLQQGLNASQASNIALARSGRGWGGSASALSQAATSNAAASQQAANQSTMLRAQEDAAFRQRAAQNLGQAAGLQQGVAGQLAQQQQANAQAALGRAGMQLSQEQLASQAALQNQGQNDAAAQGLYGLGLNAQQAAAQTGLAGLTGGAAIAQQGYGQQMQGLQAGGQMQLEGLGQSGQLASQGGVLGLSAQQAALAAQQQQVANNMAYQNQMISLHQGNQNVQMNNANNAAQADQNAKDRAVQYFGTTMNALGTAAGAISDRDKKKDIEPANKSMLVPAAPVEDIDSMAATESMLNGPNPYEDPVRVAQAQYQFGGGPMPFEQGVGISGPNQMQGPGASEQAAMAASAQSPQSTPEEPNKALGTIAKGMQGAGAGLMQRPGRGGTPGFQPIQMQPTAIPQPNMPALSDKREKTGYAMSDEDAKEAVSKTPGYSYRYKDPDAMGATDGVQFGIMAQDLEKTPAGRSVVKKQPDGTRMVDTSRLTMVNTAALNALQKHVSELEQMVRGGRKGKAA